MLVHAILQIFVFLLVTVQATITLPLTRRQGGSSLLKRLHQNDPVKRGFLPRGTPMARDSPDDGNDLHERITPDEPNTQQEERSLRSRGKGNDKKRADQASGVQLSPRSQSTSAPLHDNDVAFTVQLTIAGKEVPLILDTGSDILWVGTYSCEPCTEANMKVVNIYNIENGDDGKCKDQRLVGYGTGNCTGCLAQTDAKFAGADIPSLTVLAVNDMQGRDSDATWMSGVMGIGVHTDAFKGVIGPIESLSNAGVIPSPWIGFYLGTGSLADGDVTDGEIVLGDVDTSSHIDTTKFAKMYKALDDNPNGWYVIAVDKVHVGSKSADLGSGTGIIDTGSTGLSVPSDVADALYKSITGSKNDPANSGSWIISCKEPKGYYFSFFFGGVEFPLAYNTLLLNKVKDQEGYCSSMVGVYQATDNPKYLIGEAFLKNVYAAFNVVTGEVDFYGVK